MTQKTANILAILLFVVVLAGAVLLKWHLFFNMVPEYQEKSAPASEPSAPTR